ncbi:MAG TPA: KH domain-containing protein [Nitrososphaeraceae archaeon]|nr:KH domain-containing protein [Nitrososphaeraceae archaeon]
MSTEDNLRASTNESKVSQQFIKVPGERIGVLIGRKGAVIEKIKQECRVNVDVESESGNVIVGYDSSSLIEGNPFKALEIISAIARGFSPERAFKLLHEDVVFQLLDIRDYVGNSQSSMNRLKGRIIGERGKSRRTIEELSGADVSVYGHTVGFIGIFEAIKVAVEAIVLLTKGSSHRTVYAMLQNYRRKLKQEKMSLWEEQLTSGENEARTSSV